LINAASACISVVCFTVCSSHDCPQTPCWQSQKPPAFSNRLNSYIFALAATPVMVKRRWSVMLERTVRELQGTDCIGLEHEPPKKQEIACTRSFGHPVLELSVLKEAVTEFASRAAQKLRLQNGHAGQVLTFIRTSPFRQDPQYSRSTVVPLRRPTNDSRDINQAALLGLPLTFSARHFDTKFRDAICGFL